MKTGKEAKKIEKDIAVTRKLLNISLIKHSVAISNSNWTCVSRCVYARLRVHRKKFHFDANWVGKNCVKMDIFVSDFAIGMLNCCLSIICGKKLELHPRPAMQRGGKRRSEGKVCDMNFNK